MQLFSFLMVVQQPYSHDFTFTCVAAKTAVRLWCMERQTYRTIITNKSKKRREQLMGFLKTWVFSDVPLTWLWCHFFLLFCCCFFTRRHRSRTLKDLNDVQLSKIIDSMEEVCIIQCLGLIVNFKSEMWKSGSSHIWTHEQAINKLCFPACIALSGWIIV